jgi:predicted AAA+ superfamily ATPase
VRLLPAFSGGKRREVTTATRVHFYDMGLRNALLGAFGEDLDRRPDRGALAEGWVFGEIAKNVPFPWTVHYWRAKGGAEMDFVLSLGRRVVGVEVKSGGRTGPSRSVRSFVDAYAPSCVLLAAGPGAARSETRLGDTRLVTVPLPDLATAVREAIGAGR